MRLLFIADGRSPIALNWIRFFIEQGDEVSLVSTFPCQPELELERLEIIPVAFSSIKRGGRATGPPSYRLLKLRTKMRSWLAPISLPIAGRRLRHLVQKIKPDLIHAMRIPYEGLLASKAAADFPFVISVWGNDFTLHARESSRIRKLTEQALDSAGGLHTDCARDQRLAIDMGYRTDRPTLIAPGNGGVRKNLFFPPKTAVKKPIVFNPRGIRRYVQNEAFFKAMPLVLDQKPETKFICAAMAGEPQALRWIKEFQLEKSVRLLEPLPYEHMAETYRGAQILVSPSVHDGTPNSLLEGMACGCFPIAGDLESIREWITHGQNGLLVDATDPDSIADAILTALSRADLRADAARTNQKIVAKRADYTRCMKTAREFYGRVIFHT